MNSRLIGEMLSDFILMKEGYRIGAIYYGNKEEQKEIENLSFVLQNLVRINLHVYKEKRFILLTKSKVEKFFNKTSPDYAIGVICGIPECCIMQYILNVEMGSEEMVKFYKKQLRGKDPYKVAIDKEGNIGKEYLHHLPCSPYCKKSKRLYNLRKRVINQKIKRIGK